MDDARCYATIRELRWPERIRCPHCNSKYIANRGSSDRNCFKYRYQCKKCRRRFDDLTGTVFSGRHQSLAVWILVLYFMGLNQSNSQIAKELDLSVSTAQRMTEELRGGIHVKKKKVKISGISEFDEAYVVAGHKGNHEAVVAKGRAPRKRRLTKYRGRGTLEKDKPPVFGMIERGGLVSIHMLPNVQAETIKPIIMDTVEEGTLVYTDGYSIYNRLKEWGFEHEVINHSLGEYARDDDGDGFCEVHVNTMEGFWSLLRSWLRPHRGISQEKLPLYLSTFEFIHNARKRGKALLESLLCCLVAT